jgi:hypothetical protein
VTFQTAEQAADAAEKVLPEDRAEFLDEEMRTPKRLLLILPKRQGDVVRLAAATGGNRWAEYHVDDDWYRGDRRGRHRRPLNG